MYFNRTGRILVCLLLVCCLLVTCPPVQAYAMSPGVAAAIIIGVPAALVIGSSLIGQGILPGIGDAFNNLINDIKMSVAVQRFIYDDKIDVLASTNTATDETQYYVSQDVLEAVQEAAFETGAISISVPDIPVLRAGNAIISNGRHYSAPVDTYVFAIYPSAGYSACYLYLVSTEPFTTWVESWYNGTMDFEKKLLLLNIMKLHIIMLILLFLQRIIFPLLELLLLVRRLNISVKFFLVRLVMARHKLPLQMALKKVL